MDIGLVELTEQLTVLTCLSFYTEALGIVKVSVLKNTLENQGIKKVPLFISLLSCLDFNIELQGHVKNKSG